VVAVRPLARDAHRCGPLVAVINCRVAMGGVLPASLFLDRGALCCLMRHRYIVVPVLAGLQVQFPMVGLDQAVLKLMLRQIWRRSAPRADILKGTMLLQVRFLGGIAPFDAVMCYILVLGGLTCGNPSPVSRFKVVLHDRRMLCVWVIVPITGSVFERSESLRCNCLGSST
jgi:hypothetical protein